MKNSTNDPEDAEKYSYAPIDNNPLTDLAIIGHAGPYAGFTTLRTSPVKYSRCTFRIRFILSINHSDSVTRNYRDIRCINGSYDNDADGRLRF